jgi:hypothetical protein
VFNQAQPPSGLIVPAISTGNQVALSWTGSTTPGATYVVEEWRDDGDSIFNPLLDTLNNTSPAVATTSYTFTNNINGGVFFYRVKTVAGVYTDSDWSVGGNKCRIQLLPATGASLSSSYRSPQDIGPSIQITASGSGGSGDYEYKFLLKDNGVWSTVQGYSNDNVWSWDTSSGFTYALYNVAVYIRNTGSSAGYEAFKVISYNLAPPVSSVTLTANLPSPQTIGSSIRYDAQGLGGLGQYEYKFQLKNGGVWTVVQAYSTTRSWTFDSNTYPPGLYYISVYSRNLGSSASYEAFKLGNITIKEPPPPPTTGLKVTTSTPPPFIFGDDVLFQASGVGGSGEYEYKYSLHDGTSWTVVQDYSTTSTWNWVTGDYSTGRYIVSVYVRSLGSAASKESYFIRGYDIVFPPPPPATGANIAANFTSPQLKGENITFTASGIGGSGAYEYRFSIKDDIGWTESQAYSTNSNWTWNTSNVNITPGLYLISVYIRSFGSTSSYEAFDLVSFEIQ